MLTQGLLPFMAVVESGSFTAAADKLGVSKARVSQQISQLEKHLGVTLLHRSTRRLRLTDIGENYYRQCQRGLGILQQAEQQVLEDRQDISGRIRINSVGGLFAEQLLAPAIIAFMQAHPQVEVQLDFTSAQVDVLTDQYDLVVRMGSLSDSSLIARPLLQLGSQVVASPAYFARAGRPRRPADLLRHSCLNGSIKKWQFVHTDTGVQEDVSIKAQLASPNGHVLHRAALAGLGIIRLQSLYLEKDIRAGRLLPVFDDWYLPPSPVSLVYPKVQFKVRRVQAMVEFLLDWFASV